VRKILFLLLLAPLSAFASYDCDVDSDKLESVATPVTAYPFTLAGWIKLNATGTVARIAGPTGNVNNFWMIAKDSSDNADGLTRITGTITTANNAGTFSGTTTWHHVAFVGTSTTDVKLYFDGSGSSASDNPGGTPSSIATVIFCEDDGGFNPFDGKVGYFALWSSALSTGNIDSLAGGADPCTFSTAPDACWPMTADADDSVGSYDLTVTGAGLDGADNPPISAIAPIAQQRQQMQ